MKAIVFFVALLNRKIFMKKLVAIIGLVLGLTLSVSANAW